MSDWERESVKLKDEMSNRTLFSLRHCESQWQNGWPSEWSNSSRPQQNLLWHALPRQEAMSYIDTRAGITEQPRAGIHLKATTTPSFLDLHANLLLPRPIDTLMRSSIHLLEQILERAMTPRNGSFIRILSVDEPSVRVANTDRIAAHLALVLTAVREVRRCSRSLRS